MPLYSTDTPNFRRFRTLESDFTGATNSVVSDGLYGTVISSGSISTAAGDPNHPGVAIFRDSGTAGGGFRMMTDVSAFRLAGNEKARFIFQIGSPATGLQFRLGFQDSTTAAQPTDGAWLGVAGITGGYSLSGLTRANSTVASTTNYTLASATWYRGEIDVNSNASRVDFRLYNDSGSLLWSDFLTTQIPTAAGRETGFGMIATESSVNAATDLLLMDYFSLQIDREIVR